MFEYLSEEDAALFECPSCGERMEEQMLMEGVLTCPECGELMVMIA